MPQTIQCTSCGVVLNLPEQAMGRRLKCPKCGTRFRAEAGDEGSKPAPATPNGSAVAPDSSLLLTKNQSSGDLPVMPTAPGDLRETFDLPMMTEAAGPAVPKASAGGGQAADALALFNEPASAPRRKKKGAEGRAEARRCPTCGGVVPVGMSICQSCGLDLETGRRIGFEDEDLIAPPPPRSEGLPIPMAVVGGLCLTGSVALAVIAVFQWVNGVPGALYFAPVAVFGGYAAVQFLRAKSVKLLLAALTMGAVVDLVALIALPIYNANAETTVVHRSDVGEDPDAADEFIRPIAERLDTNSLSLGIALLFLYAVVSIYLLSPQVRKTISK
jgi:hypothetical protein